MSINTLVGETAALATEHEVARQSWELAVEKLAPIPIPVEGEELDIEAVVRYATIHYVVGKFGEEVPQVLQNPYVFNYVDPALRDIGAIRRLPAGSERRHRNVQVVLRPELSEAFAFYEKHGNSNSNTAYMGFCKLLGKIAKAEKESANWRYKAACKGEDPNIFHPEIPDDTEADAVPSYTAAAREICQRCTVTKQCSKFGSKIGKGSETVRVYGDRVILPFSRPEK